MRAKLSPALDEGFLILLESNYPGAF